MVLDVNGYNSAFRSFVDFAQLRVDANDSKAVLGVSWGLSPRVGALRVLDSRHLQDASWCGSRLGCSSRR